MKKEYLKIETPEKIIFSYKIAGVGARMGAYVVDFLIHIGIYLLLILLVLAFSNLDISPEAIDPDNLSGFVVAFIFLMVFFLQWGYFLIFEVITNGQSPGKKVMGIRVIRANGDPLDFSTLAIRNLLRVIDMFPGVYLLGGLTAVIDSRSRRLGDMVSGTMVVFDIHFNLKEPDFNTTLSDYSSGAKAVKFNGRLSENELFIIRRFLNGRSSLPAEKQNKIAGALAGQVKNRLKIKDTYLDPIVFLENIYKEHTL